MIPILLVEDDPSLGRGISLNLELEGFQVTWAKSLAEASLECQSPKFKLVILDLGLPDGSGLTLCKDLRKRGLKLPILILTAQTDEDSAVAGLQAGANDYIRKPFGNRELLARIRTALREVSELQEKMVYGELTLLTQQRKVLVGEKSIALNRREFDILGYLIAHSDAVVTREALLSALNKEGEIFDRTIDSHLSHLRAKLRQAGVQTVQISSVYGVGYRLEKA